MHHGSVKTKQNMHWICYQKQEVQMVHFCHCYDHTNSAMRRLYMQELKLRLEVEYHLTMSFDQ